MVEKADIRCSEIFRILLQNKRKLPLWYWNGSVKSGTFLYLLDLNDTKLAYHDASWMGRLFYLIKMRYSQRMHIAILGFGKEGKSALRFLKRTPRYKKAKISILDEKRSKTYLGHLNDYDLIIKSPGVPFSLPEVAKARANGVMFTSATALFFDHAKGLLIGVTGTKGKGTTSTLLHRILKQCKKDAYIAGNIGIPMLDILPKLKSTSIAVLELSSFQLQHLLFSPQIAVVLDIFS